MGHIAEEGRVIGFLTERVMDGDGNADARQATPDDFEACLNALTKLHRLGILHGDVHRYNILITDKGITLIDFANAQKSNDPLAFEEELQLFEERLHSEMGKKCGRFLKESDFEPYVAKGDGSEAEVFCLTDG